MICDQWSVINDLWSTSVTDRHEGKKTERNILFSEFCSEWDVCSETHHRPAASLQSMINDHCWSLLITVDHFWSLLITADHYWSLLITVDHCWSQPFRGASWLVMVLIDQYVGATCGRSLFQVIIYFLVSWKWTSRSLTQSSVSRKSCDQWLSFTIINIHVVGKLIQTSLKIHFYWTHQWLSISFLTSNH